MRCPQPQSIALNILSYRHPKFFELVLVSFPWDAPVLWHTETISVCLKTLKNAFLTEIFVKKWTFWEVTPCLSVAQKTPRLGSNPADFLCV